MGILVCIGVDIMKKVLNLVLIVIFCIEFTACGNSATKTVVQTNITMKSEISKVYKEGEEAFIFDDNKNKMYSIKINSVKVSNNSKYKSDFPVAEEIIDVEYTYKNIAKESKTSLQLLTSCLQVSDGAGGSAEGEAMLPKQKLQNVPVGTSYLIHGYYGLLTKSNKVIISFCGENYKKNGFPKFEIPVKYSTSSIVQGLYSDQTQTVLEMPLFAN
jgi:hypothetical protein